MIPKAGFAASLALILAACGQTDAGVSDEVAPQQEASEIAAEAAEKPAKDAKAPTAAEPAGVLKTKPPAEEIAPNLIPAAFHGTWDYIDGTCTRESDLRMEISAGQIIFYESLGQVRSIEAKDEMSLDVTLAMEGEGEVWTNVTRLTLADDGNILTPSAGLGEQAYEAIPRKRCKP